MKDEFYDEFKKCRIINARADWSKVFFGPIFSQIEHTVCKLKWFIKYIPVCDRPQAVMENVMRTGASYTITDYSSFEAHFDPEIMWSIEQPLYEYMLQNVCKEGSNDFQNMWKDVIAGNNEIIFNSFKFNVDGVRMSGEMNTSLGNGWSNLCLYLFAMWQNGATMDEIIDMNGYVEGDDGIFNTPEHLTPTSEQMEDYGFILKIDTVNKIEEASFCGLIFDPVELIPVTDPLKVLMKLAWLPRKYNNSSLSLRSELLKAKLQSALYQYNGCPIVTPLCVNLLEQLANVELTDRAERVFDRYKLRAYKESFGVIAREVGLRTRSMVANIYGISVESQLQMEAVLSKVKLWEPVILDFPQHYDLYARVYDDYVLYPFDYDPNARNKFYEFLSGIYKRAGTKIPDYRNFI